jgi:hypothetical protein
MISAIILIICPALTNLYYLYRPNAMMAKIAPLAVPVICIAQYMVCIRSDLEAFCF